MHLGAAAVPLIRVCELWGLELGCRVLSLGVRVQGLGLRGLGVQSEKSTDYLEEQVVYETKAKLPAV